MMIGLVKLWFDFIFNHFQWNEDDDHDDDDEQ